jgi:hypothetical protein
MRVRCTREKTSFSGLCFFGGKRCKARAARSKRELIEAIEPAHNRVGRNTGMSAQTKTGQLLVKAEPLIVFGRDGGIRTHDPLHPMQVRYLAALRPDESKL